MLWALASNSTLFQIMGGKYVGLVNLPSRCVHQLKLEAKDQLSKMI